MHHSVVEPVAVSRVTFLLGGRPGDDRGVDDVVAVLVLVLVLVLVRWSPGGSLPPVLSTQRGVMDRLLRRSRTLVDLQPLCRDTGGDHGKHSRRLTV